MAKLPYTEKQAAQIVANGHMSHETFAKIKAQGGFMQGFDEGGEVAQEQSVQDRRVAYTQAQNPGMSLGDAMAAVAIQDNPLPDTPIPKGGNFADQREAREKAGTYDQQLAAQKSQAAPEVINQGPIPGGVTLASNGPVTQNEVAQISDSEPSTEAGHVPTSEIGTPQAAPSMPIPGQDYYDKMNKGLDLQAKGTADATKAQASAATQEAHAMHQASQQLQREASLNQINEWDRQQAGQDALSNLQKQSQEVASGKIDPDHYWANRSTGQKIMAAIGIALGGIGQGLAGGSNTALDVINHAIDRDMESQKANLAQKNAAFQNQTSLYGLARQGHQDARSAELAHRSLGLQIAEMNIKEIMAKNQAPQIQANGAATLGALEVQQAQIKQQMAFQGYQMRAVQQAMSGGGNGQGINAEALPKEYRERYAQGVGFAKDPETRRKVEEFKGADDAFQTDMQKLREFAEKNRGTTMDRATVNKGKAMAAALQNSYRKAEGMGVYKESEAEFMKHLIGSDPTTFYNYIPQLDALTESADAARDGFYKAHISNYRAPKEGAPLGKR